MAPTRKSRSVNKRYSYVNEVSPSKNGDSANKKLQRRRKLSDMLGPQWSKEELERFYEAYRKHETNWKKVAAVLRNRTVEMVEAVYSMNRAYLSLPEGTASVAGFYAMMTDHYSNMEESNSEQESNDGAGTSRKHQKRIQGKVQTNTSKGSIGHLLSQSQAVSSSYGCLSLLKKKRTGGSRPRAVGKRTPRFPVSYSYENSNGEKYFSPTRKGLKLRTNANDDEVAHEIALALAEASQRGGSPQVSHTPNRRTDSVMSSPVWSAERMYAELEMANGRFIDTDMYEDDIEESTEADNRDLSRGKIHMKERPNVSNLFQKGKGSYGKKLQVDKSGSNHLDDIREACSGTEEGQKMGAVRKKIAGEAADAKPWRPSPQGSRKRSKKVLFKRDESSAFDALQTLADLSLMMPTATNENESSVQVKEENDDLVDESPLPQVMPANRQREKRKSSAVMGKGNQSISAVEVVNNKISKSGKGSGLDTSAIPEIKKESHQSIMKVARKRQKILASKIPKVEAHSDTNVSQSQEAEARDAGKVSMVKSKRSSQSASPQLLRYAERSSSSTDPRKEGSDSAVSAVHVPLVNQVNLPTKFRSRRKMHKPQIIEDVRTVKDKPIVAFQSLHDGTSNLKEKLSNCLLNHRVRRWCAFEWFYSAIDYPWFAKREFVEYLYHVGLGHVPRLTRVEWGVIRSSLGKPRRFSDQFLKEEKEKLNQYRESVRAHYTELRSGTREGLPTDLARPLSVGQRVVAIYPKTREIHDGSVLTVDHDRCRVQFDRPELGVAFVMDIDCMPLNPLENMPSSLASQRLSVDKFFENFNELKINGWAKGQGLEGCMKFTGENLENGDDSSHFSLSPYPMSDVLKQAQVAPINTDSLSKTGPRETTASQHLAYSLPSTLPLIQAKEADVQALAELTRALDKKEAVVYELRRMNDDVSENQKDGDAALKDSDPFKKQYAAVLVQLNEANAQVSSALYRLRQRNTYQVNFPLAWPRPMGDDPGRLLSSLDHTASQPEESECHVNEIVESSRTKAGTMVDIAIQAMSTLKANRTVEIEEAVDYVNDRLPLDDSCMPTGRSSTVSDPVHCSLSCQEQLNSAFSPLRALDPKLRNVSDRNKLPIPSELVTHCVATLFMIQKCTERQFPPADVAQILDSAVSSLQPCCSQNLPVYAEIQKCMGIIKNQILALVPT